MYLRKPGSMTIDYMPSVGDTVVTADRQTLGTVKETRDREFKVDAPMQRDYWLSCEHVASCEAGTFTLAFAKDDLGAYKLHQIAPAAVEPAGKAQAGGVMLGADISPVEAPSSAVTPRDPMREVVHDALISERERTEQRERMERDLAEQRRRLPHTHPYGEDAPPVTRGSLGGVGGTFGEPVEAELERIAIEEDGGANARRYARFGAGAFVGVTLLAAVGYFWLRRRSSRKKRLVSSVTDAARGFASSAKDAGDLTSAARSGLS